MRAPIKIAILAVSITLGWAEWTGLNALLRKGPQAADLQAAANGEAKMTKKIQKSDADWKKTLTPEQYKVMIQCGPPAAKAEAPTETATFAAGCFWEVEYKFGQVPGVLSTAVGYTGGVTKNPTYADVCTDATGHAEAIQVTFDPALTSYEELVRRFFGFHDPTQLNRQGPDVGKQYRSVIFYHDLRQRLAAENVKAEVERSGAFKKRIVTEIVPAGEFTKAEEYHQKYYEKNKKKSCGF
jgi:methionine-S-sulfoxide reductase